MVLGHPARGGFGVDSADVAAKSIASHIPGRLRLRHPSLRPAVRNAEAVSLVAAWDGVVSVEGKPRCGSVVVRYDPASIPPALIEARIGSMVAPAGGAEGPEAGASSVAGEGFSLWRLNRPAKIGMLGSLAGTLLALTMGKKLHAMFGAFHVAFLLIHLANHRKKIAQ